MQALERQTKAGGKGMYSSHRSFGGILLSLLLYTQQSNCAAKPSPPAFPPQVTAQPTIPMLDEGKGLIHLDVSVTNSGGEPVSGLGREDFELLDQNLPQKILSFHAFNEQSALPVPPVQVILFFDTLCKIYAPAPCMSEADALRAQADN